MVLACVAVLVQSAPLGEMSGLAQQLGYGMGRPESWVRYDRNPVAEAQMMNQQAVMQTEMQNQQMMQSNQMMSNPMVGFELLRQLSAQANKPTYGGKSAGYSKYGGMGGGMGGGMMGNFGAQQQFGGQGFNFNMNPMNQIRSG